MRLVLGEVLAALVCVVGAGWCWHAGVRTFVSVTDGGPTVSTTGYSGSWILAAALLVAVAGVLVIDAVGRLGARRDLPAGGTVAE